MPEGATRSLASGSTDREPGSPAPVEGPPPRPTDYPVKRAVADTGDVATAGVQVGSPVHVTGHGAQIDPQSDLVIVPASATAAITAPKAPTKSFQVVYNGDSADTNYLKSTSSATADFTFRHPHSAIECFLFESSTLCIDVKV